MTEATLFNGVREQHTYDARLRETAYGTQGPFGEVTRRRIDRDRVGNLLAVTDLVPAALGAPSGTATYTHDALYRLISASLDAERAEVAERLDWQYDDLDRIVAATSTRGGASPAHVGTYTYSRAQPNTVVSTEDDLGNVTRYTYDAAGFMQMNGPAQYRWDAAGRLLGVQRGSLEALRAGYGPGTERVVKREGAHLTWYPDPSFEVRDGVTTKYVSIGPRKVVKIERTDMQARWLSDVAPVRHGGAGMLAASPDGEIDAADAWVAQAASAEPVFGAITGADDPDVLLSAVARRMVEPAATRTTGLHHDHLGSLLATTDAAGQVLGRVEHYPYGTLRWQSDDSGDDYEYTGKEHDDAAGLTYFGARYLDARLGRWVSADPNGTTLGQTITIDDIYRYQFGRNEPSNLIDVGGLATVNVGALSINLGQLTVDSARGLSLYSTLNTAAHESSSAAKQWRVSNNAPGYQEDGPTVQAEFGKCTRYVANVALRGQTDSFEIRKKSSQVPDPAAFANELATAPGWTEVTNEVLNSPASGVGTPLSAGVYSVAGFTELVKNLPRGTVVTFYGHETTGPAMHSMMVGGGTAKPISDFRQNNAWIYSAGSPKNIRIFLPTVADAANSTNQSSSDSPSAASGPDPENDAPEFAQ
jgi:RHS repeat-associated protein